MRFVRVNTLEKLFLCILRGRIVQINEAKKPILSYIRYCYINKSMKKRGIINTIYERRKILYKQHFCGINMKFTFQYIDGEKQINAEYEGVFPLRFMSNYNKMMSKYITC